MQTGWMVCVGHLVLPGNTCAPSIALRPHNAMKRDQIKIFVSPFARGVHTPYPILMKKIQAAQGRSRIYSVLNIAQMVSLFVCLLQDASGHSNVLKAGKAEELKNARKRRTARKAN